MTVHVVCSLVMERPRGLRTLHVWAEPLVPENFSTAAATGGGGRQVNPEGSVVALAVAARAGEDKLVDRGERAEWSADRVVGDRDAGGVARVPAGVHGER